MRTDLTQQRLKELLHYDPETGHFEWRVTKGNARAGKPLCGKNTNGYIQITVDGVRYLANRLAWLYVFGDFPIGDCDHKDGNIINNKIENLRDLTRSGNLQNMCDAHDGSTSRCLGVHYSKRKGKFISQIQIDGRKIYLGQFDCESDAAGAYLRAKKDMHPASYRAGVPV